MSTLTLKYTDLDRAIEDVRSAPKEWSATQGSDGPDDETIHCACLVLHEWIANLHQHAQFQDTTPAVEIVFSFEDRKLSCSVTDNSEGFDIDAHLPDEAEEPDVLPERGMGLRIISTCTESLSYTPTEDGLHRFEFFIPSDHDPWLNTLF